MKTITMHLCKTNTLVSLILAAATFLVDQFTYAQEFNWAGQLGGSAIDKAYSVVTDKSGNIYVTGSFEGTADFDPGPGVFNLTATGSSTSSNIFIIKLDPQGNFQWAGRIGGVNGCEAHAIDTDQSGNIYITGYFVGITDFNPGPSINNLIPTGGYNVFVCKLNPDGELQWANQFEGLGLKKANSIHVDGSGNVYTTGYFQGTVDFDPGPGTFNLSASGHQDVFVCKQDSSGNFQWAVNWGGDIIGIVNSGNSVAVDSLGNVYTTGAFTKTVDFDPGPDTFNLTVASANGAHAFIRKLDNSGNFIWAKDLGIGGSAAGYSMAIDGSGNVYTTGSFGDTVDFDPGPDTFKLAQHFFRYSFLVKLKPNGDFAWAKRTGGLSHAVGECIVLDDSVNIYMTGGFRGTTDFDPGSDSTNLTAVGQDIFISKLDSFGNFQWVKYGTGSGYNNQAYSIAIDSAGNVISTGIFRDTVDLNLGPGSLSYIAEGEEDIFVLKLGDQPVGTTDPIIQNDIELFPNPSSGKVYMHLGKFYPTVDLYIRNMMGQLVSFQSFNNASRINTIINGPAGLYFIELRTDEGSSTGIKVLKN